MDGLSLTSPDVDFVARLTWVQTPIRPPFRCMAKFHNCPLPLFLHHKAGPPLWEHHKSSTSPKPAAVRYDSAPQLQEFTAAQTDEQTYNSNEVTELA